MKNNKPKVNKDNGKGLQNTEIVESNVDVNSPIDADFTGKGKKGDKDKVQLEKEFDLYCLWKSLPPMLRFTDTDKLQTQFFIDDEGILELCSLKTQKDFANYFGIHQDTLTDWNKRVKNLDPLTGIKEWVKTVTKNVVMSTYRSAMSKDAKAHQDRKLMLQLSGWSEESNLNLKGEGLFDILKRELNDQRKQ